MNEITLINKVRVTASLEELKEALLSSPQLSYTQTKIKDSVHIRSTELGFELEYEHCQLNTVFIYFRSPKIKQYLGSLPYDIHPNSTIKGIVMYLGQPNQKSNKMIEITYDHLGLGIVFQGGHGWGKEDALIEYLYYFPKQGQRTCAACLKTNTQHFCCKQCGLVGYCSEDCKKKHYGDHLVFCQDVD